MASAATQVPNRDISLYAELLSNIRQVSIAATLSSPSDATTQATLVDGGAKIRVFHRGHTDTLVLPSPVLIPQDTVLQVPNNSSDILTWRLPVSKSSRGAPNASLEDQLIPWTSAALRPGSSISCRHCKALIVTSGLVQIWKDLPSENWAEMMEFWHCHKPQDHGQHDDESLTKRGYGANSAITAQSGVGLVDLVSFMFSESDCANLLYSSGSIQAGCETSTLALEDNFGGNFLHVFCKACYSEVGNFNLLASSVTLYKWQLECETVTKCLAPNLPECLAAMLIAGISRSSYAKSVISPLATSRQSLGDSSDQICLYLWVLNPSVSYSSSSGASRTSAMKVLYQEIGGDEASRLIQSVTSDAQDISLSVAAIEAVRNALQSSTMLLPRSERQFKEWSVGLLKRWTGTS